MSLFQKHNLSDTTLIFISQVNAMNEMTISHRIGLFLVEVDCFRDSCLPYPTHVLQRVHYHLPIVAAKANNVLLRIIKVRTAHTHCS